MADTGQKDFSQLARSLVGHMTGEEETEPVEESPQVVAGRKGGEARAKTLTPDERAAIARQGGQARWTQPSA
ncbi:MAG: hypothetical protein OXI78_13745 [Anaerolineaceae bacterium]|nr:hypothetical protein [Anaerolineaceae bacterium]